MSGGHWNYSGYNIESMLTLIGNDEDIIKRFPKLSEIFIRLGSTLYTTEQTLDFDLSGDTKIRNDIKFETEIIKELKKCIN